MDVPTISTTPAPFVKDWIADGVDMLQRSIRKNNSKIGIEGCLFANCFLQGALKSGSVVGVNSFRGCVAARAVRGRIKSKNPIEFRTPIYAFRDRRIERPSARVCERRRFRQIRFPPL